MNITSTTAPSTTNASLSNISEVSEQVSEALGILRNCRQFLVSCSAYASRISREDGSVIIRLG